MKKWIIVAASLVLLFFISSYFFIPEKIIVTRSITANANPSAAYRFLTDESNWTRWWPGSVSNAQGNPVFESGGYQFKRNKTLYESFEILIEKNKHAENSLLHIFSLGLDSIRIKWTTTIQAGKNPLAKIRRYLEARETGRQLEQILTAMQKHISVVQHIYGVDIRKEKVKVEFLVSAKETFNGYPNTERIYNIISKISNYISKSQAKEDDYPMVHITSAGNSRFEVQVAIPVNKYLPGDETLYSKKMLKGGDILVTEITGGKNIADSAMKQMEQYVSDHKFVRIAIPFQSLVADRMNEPDSSKWITKIYYPIM